MTRKYLPCWIKLNSDKRLLFAVENKKKHYFRILSVGLPKLFFNVSNSSILMLD